MPRRSDQHCTHRSSFSQAPSVKHIRRSPHLQEPKERVNSQRPGPLPVASIWQNPRSSRICQSLCYLDSFAQLPVELATLLNWRRMNGNTARFSSFETPTNCIASSSSTVLFVFQQHSFRLPFHLISSNVAIRNWYTLCTRFKWSCPSSGRNIHSMSLPDETAITNGVQTPHTFLPRIQSIET